LSGGSGSFIAAMDFSEWEEWTNQEVAFFISAYCELPQYAKCAERNLNGQQLKKLSHYGNLLQGLTYAGIQDFAHQKHIASSIHRLQKINPDELNKELEMKMHAATYKKRNSRSNPLLAQLPVGKMKKKGFAVAPLSLRSTPTQSLESTTMKTMQRSQSETTLSLPHRSVERLTPLPWRCLGGSGIGKQRKTATTDDIQPTSMPSKLRKKLAQCQAHYTQMKAEDAEESAAMEARERTTAMINQLKAEADNLDKLIPSLPKWLQKLFSNKEFDELCNGKFEMYDKNNLGMLTSEEVFPLLVDLTTEQPISLTMEHCTRFVEIFDKDNSGTIDKREFRDFLRFSLAMAYLEARGTGGEDEGEEIVDHILADAKAERENRKSRMAAEQKLEGMIESMEAGGMAGLNAVLPSLPDWLQDNLTNPSFKKLCDQRFLELDEDGSNELSIEEIYPLLLELTGESGLHIEKRHCHRFISAFDKDGNGNLDLEEFTNFVRFAMAYVYLEGEKIKEQQASAQRRLQEQMSKVNADLTDLPGLIAKMPPPVRKLMDNVERSKTFIDRWNALDIDRSGTLEIFELLPLVSELCEGMGIESATLDAEQCAEFAKAFDENGDGVISKSEFADFIRFCLAMSFLDAQKQQQEEVEKIEAEAQSPQRRSLLGKEKSGEVTAKKKASFIDISEEDMELLNMNAEDEMKIAKIQAAYRGKKDRKLAAKKKEAQELQNWTDDIGDEADQMARKLQVLHKKKMQKRASVVKSVEEDDLESQLSTLKKSKTDREKLQAQKRKSALNQQSAQGDANVLFAALADEEIHGVTHDGEFDISQLSEEHRAQLEQARAATETSSEVMRKKKEMQQRQRDQERRIADARREEELKQWALSFGVDGDDAASKIQRVWRSGVAGLMTKKAQEQVQVETYTAGYGKKKGSKKKKGDDAKLQKELQEWEQSIDPKELNDAATKVQAAQRRKQGKKEAEAKRKPKHDEHASSHHEVKPSPRSPKDKHHQHHQQQHHDDVDPKEFETPEHTAAATKLQAIQRGKQDRRKAKNMIAERDGKHH
jgi:Ca2+-binding EF-hand superfamily protein